MSFSSCSHFRRQIPMRLSNPSFQSTPTSSVENSVFGALVIALFAWIFYITSCSSRIIWQESFKLELGLFLSSRFSYHTADGNSLSILSPQNMSFESEVPPPGPHQHHTQRRIWPGASKDMKLAELMLQLR
jgi:hypothetical protein